MDATIKTLQNLRSQYLSYIDTYRFCYDHVTEDTRPYYLNLIEATKMCIDTIDTQLKILNKKGA